MAVITRDTSCVERKIHGREETTTTPQKKERNAKIEKAKIDAFLPGARSRRRRERTGPTARDMKVVHHFFIFIPRRGPWIFSVALQLWQHRNNHPRCRKFQHVSALTCPHPTAPSWAFTRCISCIVQLDWCKKYLPSARPPRPPAHYALHLLGNLDTWLHARRKIERKKKSSAKCSQLTTSSLLKAREFIFAGILRDPSVNRERPLERRGGPPAP